MVKKYLVFMIVLNTMLFAEVLQEGRFVKEKKEIQALKKDLSEFYDKKEAQYKKQKAQLQVLQSKIEKEKNEIADLVEEKKSILKDIREAVASKTKKIYDKMKPKIAAKVFNKMVSDGKIDDVFDIIVRLKEKQVMKIIKYLEVEHSATLTKMLKDYQSKKGEGNNG